MKTFRLILLLVSSCVLQGLVESTEEEETTPDPFGYLVVSPKVLFAGKEETICVTIKDADETVQVSLRFMENNVTEIFRSQPFNVEFDTACAKVEVPSVDEYPKRVILSVQMKRLSAAETELEDEKKVVIFKTGTETYVQTDKPIYKPGQTVMFRVLTLDKELKPDPTAVSDIWVETPSGIRVAQWLDQTSEDGLLDLEVPMSPDPPLGEWKIVVVRDDKRIERTFKVDEYVLPKFEVMITIPPYIVINTKEFEVRICARYTYGQPVRGSFSADVSIDQDNSYWYRNSEPRPVLRFESVDTGESGCGTIIVSGEEMRLNESDYSVWSSRLKVDVNFTEAATGVTLSETALSKNGLITTDPLQLTFKGPSTFKPGMPFDIWLTVAYPDGTPAPGKDVRIVVRADGGEIFNQTFSSMDNGMIHTVLEDIDINTRTLNIFAEAPGYKNWKPYDPEDDDEDRYNYFYIYDPVAYLYAEASYSPSGSFVHIAAIDEQLIPDTEQEITTYFTADPELVADLKWFFVFMSRGEILTVPVSAVEDEEPRRKRTTEIEEDILVSIFSYEEETVNITQPGQLFSRKDKFTVTTKMSPVIRLLVYYILPDQEVVADSVKFNVKPVFDNKVSIAFASTEEAPGGKAVLKMSASGGSLCAIGIVDKSVYVLEEAKDQLTKDKVFDKMRQDEEYNTNYWLPNPSDHCPNEFPWWWYGNLDRRRRRRTVIPYGGGSAYEDSSKAFEDMGVIFMSNMKVETRPCSEGFFYPVAYDSGGGVGGPVARQESIPVDGAGDEGLAASVRSFFPETWLWKLERIGDSGEGELKLDVPHTITDWVSNGFCTSAETGLGVADTGNLRAFQPFFVSLTLPYSIIRGEEVPIKATVFNYLSDECVVVRISLIESDKLDVADNTFSHKECVCAQTSKTVEFLVRALALGDVDIEVHAVSVQDEEFLCGNEVSVSTLTGVSDAVRRKILVEPEGLQQEYNINKYFCPSELPFSSYIKRFNLAAPPNVVEGSVRGRITLTGDLMGQTINNLDSLLRIPSGCGEQNMLGFVPNIVAMQYFTKSGTLTDDVKMRAETNMRRGYMRELNYRHKDGSYSAFGESDDSGSTWLTAYVVRSFAQASEFIQIDQEDLDISIEWLKQKQNKRGCFNAVGKLCHKAMAGGVNNEITLTSYVVTSLLQAGVAAEDPVIQNALACLETESDSLFDTYAAAQLAYTMALAGHPDASDLITYLGDLAVDEGDTKHWVSNRNDSSEYGSYYVASKLAQEIEMTSYVLLAYTQQLPVDRARILGSPIARWLIGQRTGSGGFTSTQDTVIGIQALAAYAGILSSDPLKMQVELMAQGRKIRQFELLEKNKLIMQEMDLSVPNAYMVRARGRGCGLLQFTVYYNMLPQTPPVAPFTLTKSARNLDRDCTRYTTNMCASYTGTGGSNMVLAEVKLMTGFTPDASSIDDLRAQSLMSKLKRVDTNNNVISFYLDQGLDETPVCWDFMAVREFDVKNAKPGTVNMYDYYEKDLSISDSLEFLCELTEEPEPVTPDMPETPDVTPSAKPDKPPVEPEVDPPAKPDKPPVEPEVEPTAKPDKPPVEPEVEPTAKPDKPPVEPEVDPPAKPDKPPVQPEVDPPAKPDKPPVTPEVDPPAKPDKPPVQPEVDPSAKPDKPPVEPEVDPSAKPDKPPVEPEVAPSAKPDKPPVEPVVDPSAKPEKPPVEPEVDPSAKPEKPPVEPEVDPSAKPEKPPVQPEVDPSAKPDKPPVEPEVDPTGKPEKPPVEPEVDPTAKPDKPPVEPEVDPTGKPEKPPVEPEVVPSAKPDKPPVEPEVDPSAKPEKPPVEPEVEPTAKPDKPPVQPEVDPSAKPDKPPVEPEVEPTAKPEKPTAEPEIGPSRKPGKPPVELEVDPTAKPDKPPVEPEVDPAAKPDKPLVEPEVDPTGKPDKPPVEPAVDPTGKPDKPPVEPAVDPTGKPDKPPVEPAVDPTAKPDKPPVQPEVDPTGKPDKPPVEPAVDPTGKPDKPPVEPAVDPTGKPDKPPVAPEVDPTAKPDKPPVQPEVDPTGKPDKLPVEPAVEPTAKPDKPPVEPAVEPTAKPDKPPVEPEVVSTVEPTITTTHTPVPEELTSTTSIQTTIPTTIEIIADTMCLLYPTICGNGVCVDDETQPTLYRCDCDPGFVEELGMCVAITTTSPPPTTTPTPTSTTTRIITATTATPPPTPTLTPTTTVVIGDPYCFLYPTVCGNGNCVDDETFSPPYRCECDSGFMADGGTCVDVNECAIEDICLNPNKVCSNLDGTYECNCREGFQEDDQGNCFACPICRSSFPSGFEEKYCVADYVYGTKIRDDGMLRILSEFRQQETRIQETRYIDPVVDDRCDCDQLTYGDRILLVTTADKADIQQLKKKTIETVDLGGAYIVPLRTHTKQQLENARTGVCSI